MDPPYSKMISRSGASRQSASTGTPVSAHAEPVVRPIDTVESTVLPIRQVDPDRSGGALLRPVRGRHPMTLRGLICAVTVLVFLPGVAAQARTVVVRPVPGDPAASGAILLAALADLEGTAVDPGLLKLEAGVYDIGFKTLLTKPHVDVEGSGEGVTTITGKSPREAPIPTVMMRNSTELRFLTVENRGPGVATAIVFSVESPRLTHVTLRASNGRYNFVVDRQG